MFQASSQHPWDAKGPRGLRCEQHAGRQCVFTLPGLCPKQVGHLLGPRPGTNHEWVPVIPCSVDLFARGFTGSVAFQPFFTSPARIWCSMADVNRGMLLRHQAPSSTSSNHVPDPIRPESNERRSFGCMEYCISLWHIFHGGGRFASSNGS